MLQYGTRFQTANTFPAARPPAAPPPESDLPEDHTTNTLRRLLALVAEHNLAELTVEEDGLTVCVKGVSEDPLPPIAVTHVQAQAFPVSASHAPAPAPIAAAARPTPAAPTLPARPAGLVAVESPMVGVFYRSPSPEDPPFVNVGDPVAIGQTIGLIEAMKVYSELPSEVAGRIVEIAAESGKLVKQGQALYYVEPA